MLKNTIRIFGYGTLINEKSLRKTVPDATNIFPAKLFGFIRVFNILETRQLTRKNCGNIAVLNIEKSEFNQFINGVCFDMPIKEIEKLQEREKQYELIQVEVEEWNKPSNKHLAFVWRAKHFDVFDFQFKCKAQEEYLDICLKGCKNFGDEFLKEFKKTTFIGDEYLEKIPQNKFTRQK